MQLSGGDATAAAYCAAGGHSCGSAVNGPGCGCELSWDGRMHGRVLRHASLNFTVFLAVSGDHPRCGWRSPCTTALPCRCLRAACPAPVGSRDRGGNPITVIDVRTSREGRPFCCVTHGRYVDRAGCDFARGHVYLDRTGALSPGERLFGVWARQRSVALRPHPWI
jgi:hypothetical protein